MVTTADGDEYLDFTAGIAVASTGHCHPQVVAAIQEQAATVHPRAGQLLPRTTLLEALAERLAEITPAASTRSSSPTPAPRPPRPR